MPQEWTGEQLRDALVEGGYEITAFSQVIRWLDRGDQVAVYQNMDLGHSQVGQLRFTSYGSAQAQLEREQFPDGPPQRMPDIGSQINWRYQLIAVCTTGPVPLPA